MTKLRAWASERGITLYGKVKEAPDGGYMQWGHTHNGSRFYLVDKDDIYRWGGMLEGWKPMVCATLVDEYSNYEINDAIAEADENETWG